MTIPRSLHWSRALGALAVLSAPLFVWTGWWQLALSVALATAAALLVPRGLRGDSRGWFARTREALDTRFHPHRWRPGKS
jgi:membrane protein implicated in regulation of membrane protease activity